jgi:hypothetical protein
VLESYERNLPKATAHIRVALKFLHGELFREKLKQYTRPLVTKGVPPMIVDLKEFYGD